MLLTFIAELTENPGQQVKFQMPPSKLQWWYMNQRDRRKEMQHFFPLQKNQRTIGKILVSPVETLLDRSAVRRLGLALTRARKAGGRVSSSPARLTHAENGSCSVSSVGKLRTLTGTFSNQPANRGKAGSSRQRNRQETGRRDSTYTKATSRNTRHQRNL
jgi:hypothetical protein